MAFHSQVDRVWEVSELSFREYVICWERLLCIICDMGLLCHPIKPAVINKLSPYMIIGPMLFLRYGCSSYQEGEMKKHSALHMSLFYLLLITYTQGSFVDRTVFYLAQMVLKIFWEKHLIEGCWLIFKSYFYSVRGPLKTVMIQWD